MFSMINKREQEQQQIVNNLNNNNNEERSKIPIVRATTTTAAAATMAGSSATIPPIRSSVRLQHHMMLRGRSRIRHHRRNCGVAGATVNVPQPCSSVSARNATSHINSNNNSNMAGRSVSAVALDANSNPVLQKEATFSYAKCRSNKNNVNNNNSINDDSLSDNSCSISSSSSISRPVIRRRFNANLSSTDTKPLNNKHAVDETTVINNNNYIIDSGSSSGGSCSTTISAIKRNKRSLSSTRLDKDKYDEYNIKLQRKTTPPLNNNKEKSLIKTTETTTIKPTTTTTARFTRSRKDQSTVSSSSTSGIPTPTSGLNSLYLSRQFKHTDALERQKQQQQLAIKLRKKISY